MFNKAHSLFAILMTKKLDGIGKLDTTQDGFRLGACVHWVGACGFPGD